MINCFPLDYISFAAHTDYEGTSQFIRDVKPPHIVCMCVVVSPPLYNTLSPARFWCMGKGTRWQG